MFPGYEHFYLAQNKLYLTPLGANAAIFVDRSQQSFISEQASHMGAFRERIYPNPNRHIYLDIHALTLECYNCL